MTAARVDDLLISWDISSKEGAMADVLIRDVPDGVLRVIDANARRLGLSRSEYLRRQLSGEARGGPVSSADLTAFGETFADLDDDEVMSRAWR